MLQDRIRVFCRDCIYKKKLGSGFTKVGSGSGLEPKSLYNFSNCNKIIIVTILQMIFGLKDVRVLGEDIFYEKVRIHFINSDPDIFFGPCFL